MTWAVVFYDVKGTPIARRSFRTKWGARRWKARQADGPRFDALPPMWTSEVVHL